MKEEVRTFGSPWSLRLAPDRPVAACGYLLPQSPFQLMSLGPKAKSLKEETVFLIVPMRKLKLREVKQPAQGHTASECQTQDYKKDQAWLITSMQDPLSCLLTTWGHLSPLPLLPKGSRNCMGRLDHRAVMKGGCFSPPGESGVSGGSLHTNHHKAMAF